MEIQDAALWITGILTSLVVAAVKYIYDKVITHGEDIGVINTRCDNLEDNQKKVEKSIKDTNNGIKVIHEIDKKVAVVERAIKSIEERDSEQRDSLKRIEGYILNSKK